jgi:hypothetical protein
MVMSLVKTLSFYLKDHEEYPDETDLVVVHDQYNEAQKAEFLQAVYIFLIIIWVNMIRSQS